MVNEVDIVITNEIHNSCSSERAKELATNNIKHKHVLNLQENQVGSSNL